MTSYGNRNIFMEMIIYAHTKKSKKKGKKQTIWAKYSTRVYFGIYKLKNY